MKRILVIIIAVLLAVSIGSDVMARAKWKTVSGLATTIAPGVSDTSNTLSCSTWDSVQPVIICESDSALVTIQHSVDGTTWLTLMTKQIDGTDGTTALQWNTALTRTGYTGSTFTEAPPLNYLRCIVNVNDSAGADTLSGLVFRLYYKD